MAAIPAQKTHAGRSGGNLGLVGRLADEGD